jgi:hypothetical protein
MPGREFRGEETVDVGGEWFLMWQSKMWNGQEEAFRMFTILGVAFLVVVQREPTRDQSATPSFGGTSTLARHSLIANSSAHRGFPLDSDNCRPSPDLRWRTTKSAVGLDLSKLEVSPPFLVPWMGKNFA